MKQSGFTLIEVLVAVLILSLGLLGMAALQTQAMKTNQSALQRSQAVILANFMMDAMRANRLAATNNQYNLGTNGTPGSPVCNAPGDINLITHDQAHWLTAMKETLGDNPATCGLISCQANNCIVKVFWDDSRSGGGNQQFIEVVSRI